MEPVTVIGAGLAGSECALQLARRGIPVRLCEMKPHQALAGAPQRRPGGAGVQQLLPLRQPGDAHRHAARRAAAAGLAHPRRGRPGPGAGGRGPGGRPGALLRRRGAGARCRAGARAGERRGGVGAAGRGGGRHRPAHLRGADPGALAAGPGTSSTSTTPSRPSSPPTRSTRPSPSAPAAGARASGDDYLNLPLDEAQYRAFVAELRAAEKVTPHAFEEPRYFEGCLPIEVMAERGEDTLAYGPMKPVGLTDPRTGKRPHAVVQLRHEDVAGTAYNLVGFQTRLTWPEQKRIFRSLPGLADAEFLRMGQIHRNTFIDAPAAARRGPRAARRTAALVRRADHRRRGLRRVGRQRISGLAGHRRAARGPALRPSAGGDRAGRALPARHRRGPSSRTRLPAVERHLRPLPTAARSGAQGPPPRGARRPGPGGDGPLARASPRSRAGIRLPAPGGGGRMRTQPRRALLVLIVGCSKEGSGSKAPEAPLVGGLGKRIVSGPVADLRLSKDGAWATFLHNPKRPAVEGVSPKMALGELGLVPLSGGAVRFVGPGRVQPAGQRPLQPGQQVALLRRGRTTPRTTPGRFGRSRLGRVPSPRCGGRRCPSSPSARSADAFAFVDGGVLRVARLEAGSAARDVATEVSTAQFTPDGKWLVVQRRAAAGGGAAGRGGRGRACPGPPRGERPGLEHRPRWEAGGLHPHQREESRPQRALGGHPSRGKGDGHRSGGHPACGAAAALCLLPGRWVAGPHRARARAVGQSAICVRRTRRRDGERWLPSGSGQFWFAPDGKAVAVLANYDEKQQLGAPDVRRRCPTASRSSSGRG